MLKKMSLMMMMVSFFILSGCNTENKDGITKTNGLNILAGSELKNIEPILKDASSKLGFPINIQYVGTIEGVDKIKSGASYDIAWFGNAKYFYDTAESAKRIKLSEKIILSPVIVGVRESSFNKYHLDKNKQYTWKDIAGWVLKEKMTYAMTDPSVSNTGYVALMGVVYATSDKGENITISDVNDTVLKQFFSGQKITAKSSSWIMDTFNKEKNIDFVINYESVILNNSEKLIPIYPTEGIVTSDYPMLLLDNTKVEQYKQLVDYLKNTEIQEKFVNDYKYRSINSGVMIKQHIFDTNQLLVEMPFNPDMQLSDTILHSYFNEYKKPAKFAFVIDTSGSMEGSRERDLKEAIRKLVGGELSKFANIRKRESVIVIPFADKPYDIQKFSDAQTHELLTYVQSLSMHGRTSMYDGVIQAIDALQKDKQINGDTFRYSIIVLTDGESNSGADFTDFKAWYQQQAIKSGDMRVFAISFGDSDLDQLNDITKLTGGNIFDGKTSLGSAFREIRTYQ